MANSALILSNSVVTESTFSASPLFFLFALTVVCRAVLRRYVGRSTLSCAPSWGCAVPVSTSTNLAARAVRLRQLQLMQANSVSPCLRCSTPRQAGHSIWPSSGSRGARQLAQMVNIFPCTVSSGFQREALSQTSISPMGLPSKASGLAGT